MAVVGQHPAHIIRDGHGIPKCSPCPSVFFLIPPDPSVHFCGFFGCQVRMSIIRTTENPKNGKIGAEIHASVYKKLWSPYFLKKYYKVLKLQAI